MVNRIEIEKLLQSKELKKLWQTIQQELPQLHFYEENDSWEKSITDSLEDFISECNTLLCKQDFQELSIRDLYTCLSSECFRIFCKESLLDFEKDEFIINEIERDFILNELGMSEDEYKNLPYDIINIIFWSIDYYLLSRHPEILLDYYKIQGVEEPEQMFKYKMNLYSMCKR